MSDIRLAISALELSYAERSLGRTTASFGIALFPDHAQDADALLRAADIALYAAKGAGRNRVTVGQRRSTEPDRPEKRVGAGSVRT